MRLKHFSVAYGLQIFKSFSDEARIRILFLIFQNKHMCISDLEHILDFTQTKTSRHLSYLKNSGIVNAKKFDQWVFYTIKDEVLEILSQMFKFLNKDQMLLKDAETFRILFSNRELALNKPEVQKWMAQQNLSK
ncbi:metalloregulator ArsR/SmtB family transcription factor [Cytophagales bacterium LB-30]|uniref:Metalloregulator ArsR/SmtB family transcription factor n=1 Tax=Shiella aurantiaca TaxID=3058365 RepID=A0ABT8FA88_9BACT|nr:metalloregulator ArsR/SmtB family transcription factor [Shiella aurantiaca]MDN4166881.1 metalloregulator ArsR/SmtB family transcription factor [Shiella aurantiaca]